MNKFIVAIISGIVGVGIGYIFGTNKEEKKYNDLIDEYYTREIENENFEQNDEPVIPMSMRVSPDYDREEEKPDLEDLASRYRSEDEHPVEDEPDEPYVITYDEFSEIGTNYTELLYYDEDDTLVDDEDRVLDIPSTVGDCLSEFGVGTDDKDMVYVKNPKTGKYYEVTRLYEPYYPVN